MSKQAVPDGAMKQTYNHLQSAHLMDTLLSHETKREELWMAAGTVGHVKNYILFLMVAN